MPRHFKNPFLLILAAAAFIGAVHTDHAANGVPEISFYPAHGWQAAQAENGTCGIGATFNNGFNLSFQGAQQAEALTIDFLQDAFEAGQSYDVKLSVPGAQSTTLKAAAPQANILSIPLGGQGNLFRAMRDFSVFDMNVGGNDFRFYLSGLATAGDFQTCPSATDSMTNTAAIATQAPAPVMDDPAADVIQGWDPENLLDATNMDDTFENVDFSDEALGLAPAEPMPDSRAVTPAPITPVPSAVEKQALDSPPDMLPVTPALTPPPKQEMVVHKQTTTVDADFTQTGLPPAQAEPVQNAGIFERQANDPHLARKISELEKMVGQLKQENQALTAELGDLRNATQEEQRSIASENWNLESATMRYNEAERQIKKLGAQIQRDRAQCNTEKKELETMLFDPKLTEERQLARLAELEQKLTAAEAQLGQCQ